MSLGKKYIASVSKAMQGKLKESPVEGPRTRVEPAIMVAVCSTETEQLRLLSNLQTGVIIVKEGRKSVWAEEKSGLAKVIGSVND